MCGCLSHAPHWGPGLAGNPGICPNWEPNQWPPGLQTSAQSLSHTSQGETVYFNEEKETQVYSRSSQPFYGHWDSPGGAAGCSFSEQKPLCKGLSYSICLSFGGTAIVNNRIVIASLLGAKGFICLSHPIDPLSSMRPAQLTPFRGGEAQRCVVESDLKPLTLTPVFFFLTHCWLTFLNFSLVNTY